MTHVLPPIAKADAQSLALAGLGVAVAGRHYVTAMNRTPPHQGADLVSPARQPAARLARQVYACGEDFPCDPFAHDMLSRSAAIADGNGFFGDYTPDAYKRASLGRTGGPGPVDLAIQYRAEAIGALKALDGLNIPPDLLVGAAFVAHSSQRLCAGASQPAREHAINALAQLCVRLLCDQATAADANAAYSGLQAALASEFGKTGLANPA